MTNPRCPECHARMRVTGLLPVEEGGRSRVFQVWTCQMADCGKGQETVEPGTVERDEMERFPQAGR